MFAIAANGTAPGLALPVQPPVRRRELLQTNMEKFLKIFVACVPTVPTPSQPPNHHQAAALEQCRHDLLSSTYGKPFGQALRLAWVYTVSDGDHLTSRV